MLAALFINAAHDSFFILFPVKQPLSFTQTPNIQQFIHKPSSNSSKELHRKKNPSIFALTILLNKIVNMQKEVEQSSASKEAAILAAAEREFLTKGFAGARTVSIAQAAGVTHAMLHYYFRTKEHLFDRILEEKMRILGESVLAACGQPGLPVADRIRDSIERHFDFITANPDLPRFIVNEVFTNPQRYKTMQKRISLIADRLIADLQQGLDAAADAGEGERIDARMLILDIISLNIFPFLAYPIIEPVFGYTPENRTHFLALRKQENVEIILRRIKK